MMISQILFVHVVTVTFVIVNFTNLIVLMGMLENQSSRKSMMVLGYFLSTLIVVGVTISFCIFIPENLAQQYMKWFGIVPFGLGGYLLFKRKEAQKSVQAIPKSAVIFQGGILKQCIMNCVAQLGCSTGNVLVFLPILFHYKSEENYLIFGGISLFLCLLLSAILLLFSSKIKAVDLESLYEKWFPYILIALGVGIFFWS